MTEQINAYSSRSEDVIIDNLKPKSRKKVPKKGLRKVRKRPQPQESARDVYEQLEAHREKVWTSKLPRLNETYAMPGYENHRPLSYNNYRSSPQFVSTKSDESPNKSEDDEDDYEYVYYYYYDYVYPEDINDFKGSGNSLDFEQLPEPMAQKSDNSTTDGATEQTIDVTTVATSTTTT